MTQNDKDYLLEKLTETHNAIEEILEGVDLELPVYSETGWRIRDILGHIATWDREVINTLRAFMQGEVYLTPDLDESETDFNQRAMLNHRQLSTPAAYADWQQAREAFSQTVKDIPLDRFPGDVLFPWGDERGTIQELVSYMTDHNLEHRAEIVEAIKMAG